VKRPRQPIGERNFDCGGVRRGALKKRVLASVPLEERGDPGALRHERRSSPWTIVYPSEGASEGHDSRPGPLTSRQRGQARL
jgi:hypothetical protein